MRRLVLITALAGLPSCAFLKDTVATRQGVEPLSPDIDKIDLVKLIDNRATSLQEAVTLFVKAPSGETYTDASQKMRRDTIQELILAKSDEVYRVFARQIREGESNVNFTIGALTILTAGLGAIFSAPSTVRSLAGSAAILSGTRAEYNDVYFKGLALHVILAGIKAKRADIYSDIQERQKGSISDYNISAALRDTFLYHSAINVVVGLEAASDMIQVSVDPGLNRMSKLLRNNPIMKRLGFTENSLVREQANATITKLGEIVEAVDALVLVAEELPVSPTEAILTAVMSAHDRLPEDYKPALRQGIVSAVTDSKIKVSALDASVASLVARLKEFGQDDANTIDRLRALKSELESKIKVLQRNAFSALDAIAVHGQGSVKASSAIGEFRVDRGAGESYAAKLQNVQTLAATFAEQRTHLDSALAALQKSLTVKVLRVASTLDGVNPGNKALIVAWRVTLEALDSRFRPTPEAMKTLNDELR